MHVKIKSLLGNIQKTVTNTMQVDTIADIDKLLRQVVTDRNARLIREDLQECEIVANGSIHTDVYNNKSVLLAWINHEVDEYPPEHVSRKASV